MYGNEHSGFPFADPAADKSNKKKENITLTNTDF